MSLVRKLPLVIPPSSRLALVVASLGLWAARGHAEDIRAYPAVVVGSGYGGSVAALRLAQAGVRTVVLERGRWWSPENGTSNEAFPTLESVMSGEDGRSNWLGGECTGNLYMSFLPPVECPATTGLLEVVGDTPNPLDLSPRVRSEGVQIMTAAGVGGGSLINNGITYAPSEHGWEVAFHDLPHMREVYRDLRKRYFRRAARGLGATPVPEDILTAPEYEGSRLLYAMAGAYGFPEEQEGDPETELYGRTFVPALVDWDVVRQELRGERVRAAVAGEAWYGMNSGAKASLDRPKGYLGRALDMGGVDVRALHTVTEIRNAPGGRGYLVTAVETDETYSPIEEHVFRAERLFVAAGSVGTTKLLLRARETGALPGLTDAVGTLWSTNGTQAHLRVVAQHPVGQGGPGTVKLTDASDPSNPVVIENLPQRVPSVFANIPELAPLQGAIMTIGLGVPSQKGWFDYDPVGDTVSVHWPEGAASNVYAGVTRLLADEAFPGTPIILPPEQAMQMTLHPLGGVPLGVATSLDRCEVVGAPGLYAMDGSLVPGASGLANPSLLITALAERCMAAVIREIAREHHDCGSAQPELD